MKKPAIALAVSLTLLAMLLPIIGIVNHSFSTPQPAVQHADGNPMPPPVPPWMATPAEPTLLADGNPMPPPVPPWMASAPLAA
jgi:hypothetical protein